jgi:hypothetical protein
MALPLNVVLVKTLLSLDHISLIAIDLEAKLFEKTLPLSVIVRLTVCPVATEGQTKVRDFQVSGSTDEEIVRFDIARDPLHAVSFLDA